MRWLRHKNSKQKQQGGTAGQKTKLSRGAVRGCQIVDMRLRCLVLLLGVWLTCSSSPVAAAWLGPSTQASRPQTASAGGQAAQGRTRLLRLADAAGRRWQQLPHPVSVTTHLTTYLGCPPLRHSSDQNLNSPQLPVSLQLSLQPRRAREGQLEAPCNWLVRRHQVRRCGAHQGPGAFTVVFLHTMAAEMQPATLNNSSSSCMVPYR